ncbi:hypothetical protein TNCV_3825971 [Trichonephila clavipes]|nr:hypothetical protein TNCV_3825971 [Trichonephila clavipes]
MGFYGRAGPYKDLRPGQSAMYMNRYTVTELVDIHFICALANGNARVDARLYWTAGNSMNTRIRRGCVAYGGQKSRYYCRGACRFNQKSRTTVHRVVSGRAAPCTESAVITAR